MAENRKSRRVGAMFAAALAATASCASLARANVIVTITDNGDLPANQQFVVTGACGPSDVTCTITQSGGSPGQLEGWDAQFQYVSTDPNRPVNVAGHISGMNLYYNIYDSDGVTISDTLQLVIDALTPSNTNPNNMNVVVQFRSDSIDESVLPSAFPPDFLPITMNETGSLQTIPPLEVSVFDLTATLSDLTVQFSSDADPVSVPEPGSLALFGAALAGFGIIRLRTEAARRLHGST
jgi:hypothetical protein